MDMALPIPEQRLFFTTGRRQGEGLDAIDGLALRPAVLARYRDLRRLRYDFPLVLVADGVHAAQQRKARDFLNTVERLIVRLSDILRAAFIHSEAGQRPDALRAALGGAHRRAFDFDVMSRLVTRGVPKDELPASRHARIERA